MRLTLSAIVEASSKWDVNRFRPDALRRQLTPGDLLSRRCLELASLEVIEQLFCCREIDVFPQTGSADLTAWMTNFFFATLLHVLSSPRGPDAFESTKVENGTSWSRMLPVPGLWRSPLSKSSKLFEFFLFLDPQSPTSPAKE